MSVIIFLFFICSGSILAATYGRKGEEIVSVMCLSIIIVLYAFYYFDLLRVGYIVVFITCVSFYLLALIRFIRLRRDKEACKNILKNIFTLPMAIFAVLSILSIFYLNNCVVSLWDELRLWGAYPKILFYTEKLQLGSNAILYDIMQSYMPGMPLFAYFVSKSAGVFFEWHIYYAYAIFYFSLFVSCLKGLKWNKIWIAFPVAALGFLLPLTFFNSYNDLGDFYKSLFIDPMLGLLAAYLFYLASKKPFMSVFTTYQFASALFVIILFKDSGILFAIMALMAALCTCFLWNHEKTKLTLRQSCGRIAACAGSILLPYASWKYILPLYGIHNHISFRTCTLNDYFNFIRSFGGIIKNLPVVTSNFSELNRYLTFPFYFILIFIVIVILITFSKPEGRRPKMITSAALGIVNILFLIGLFILFLRAFNGGYGSYQRYICTILLSDIVFFVFLVLSMVIEHEIDVSRKRVKALFSILIVLSVFIFPFRTPQVFHAQQRDEAAYHAQIIHDSVFHDLHSEPNKTINVCVLIHETNAALHHHIYFDLIEDNIFVKNFYTETNIVVGDDASQEQIENAVVNWCKYLSENDFDYVYIVYESTLFTSEYKSIFAGENVMPECLYAVNITDDTLTLEPVLP